jgi:hypothetical protein
VFQLIGSVAYLMVMIYLMVLEIRLFLRLKKQYFRHFWSYIDVTLIVCAWAYVAVLLWRSMECRRISDRFAENNGYVYLNLQLVAYINDLLNGLLAVSAYAGTLRCLRFCQYHSRLSLFTNTLAHAGRALCSFAILFAIIFMAFVLLFYLLFASSRSPCASLLHTAATLFEMALGKFDTQQILHANCWLVPLASVLFVLVVVFVCLNMFVSIITDSFRSTLKRQNRELDQVFRLMWQRLLHAISKFSFERSLPLIRFCHDERLRNMGPRSETRREGGASTLDLPAAHRSISRQDG